MSELSVGQLRGLTVNNNVVTVPAGHTLYAPGHVLQVVQAVKTDVFTAATGASFVPVTGLSATITPKFASSKILILVNIQYGIPNGAETGIFRLSGGNTASYIGDTSGSKTRGLFGGGFGPSGTAILLTGSISYLDSPATTSATTYGVEVRPGGTVYVNRSFEDVDEARRPRGASSIILMEIAQ